MGKRTGSIGAVLVALLLVVGVACGGDSSSGSGDSTTTTAGGSPGTTGGSGGGSDDPYAPKPLATPETLTLSISGPFEFVFPVFVAERKGEFAKENLTVDVITLPATGQFPSLVSGESDVAAIGVAAGAFNAIDQGIPIRFFMSTPVAPAQGTREGLWVRKDLVTADGRLDPSKVDGMKVILGTQGKTSPTVFNLDEALVEVGKTVDDVEVTVLDPGADSMLALQNGAVDGANLQVPFSDDPGLDACCVLVKTVRAAGKYAALVDSIEANPEMYEAFVRALVRTNRTYLDGNYHSDPEMGELLSEFTTAPIDTVRAAKSYYDFGTEASNDTTLAEALQRLWIGFGDILGYDTPMPVDDYSTDAIVDAVNSGG